MRSDSVMAAEGREGPTMIERNTEKEKQREGKVV